MGRLVYFIMAKICTEQQTSIKSHWLEQFPVPIAKSVNSWGEWNTHEQLDPLGIDPWALDMPAFSETWAMLSRMYTWEKKKRTQGFRRKVGNQQYSISHPEVITMRNFLLCSINYCKVIGCHKLKMQLFISLSPFNCLSPPLRSKLCEDPWRPVLHWTSSILQKAPNIVGVQYMFVDRMDGWILGQITLR